MLGRKKKTDDAPSILYIGQNGVTQILSVSMLD